MNFVDKVMSGQENPANLAEYVDQWDINSKVPIYKMLGFVESDWLKIVQDIRCYPYVLQEIAMERGLLGLDKDDYKKFLKAIAPQDSQDVLKAIVMGTGESFISKRVQSLFDKGVIDRIPKVFIMKYRGYLGMASTKMFVDLEELALVKFNWQKLEGGGDVKTSYNPVEHVSESSSGEQDGSVEQDGPDSAGVSNEKVLSEVQELPMPEKVHESTGESISSDLREADKSLRIWDMIRYTIVVLLYCLIGPFAGISLVLSGVFGYI